MLPPARGITRTATGTSLRGARPTSGGPGPGTPRTEAWASMPAAVVATPAELAAKAAVHGLVDAGEVPDAPTAKARLADTLLHHPLASKADALALLEQLETLSDDGKLTLNTHRHLADALMHHASALPDVTDEFALPPACHAMARSAARDGLAQGLDGQAAVRQACDRYRQATGHRLLDPNAMLGIAEEVVSGHAMEVKVPMQHLVNAGMAMTLNLRDGANIQDALHTACAHFERATGAPLTDPIAIGSLISAAQQQLCPPRETPPTA